MDRNGFFNMFYFGFYHTVKEYLPPADDGAIEFLRKFAVRNAFHFY